MASRTGRYGDTQHGAGIIRDQADQQGVAFLGGRDEFIQGVGLGACTGLVVGSQLPGQAPGQELGVVSITAPSGRCTAGGGDRHTIAHNRSPAVATFSVSGSEDG
jgi:hypothetical protein